MINAFFVNKFRGDIQLFDEGYAAIETLTGWKGLGIVPWLASVRKLPPEDGVTLEKPNTSMEGTVEIAVPMLSRIANFEDFDPLAQEPSVRLTMITPGKPIPARAALIILPGTKANIADLALLRENRRAHD